MLHCISDDFLKSTLWFSDCFIALLHSFAAVSDVDPYRHYRRRIWFLGFSIERRTKDYQN